MKIEKMNENSERSYAFLKMYNSSSRYFFKSRTFGVAPILYPSDDQFFDSCNNFCYSRSEISDPFLCKKQEIDKKVI